MARVRSYRLLCPIARALDRVGDRWSLLILRDLHAGPARFAELQRSFPGLASNLLTTRLQELQENGLVERTNDGTAWVYELTEDGRATSPILFELAMFGAGYPPRAEVRRPGNLRTVAVTMQEALRRVVGDDVRLRAELVVDDEPFAIVIEDGAVDVSYGPDPDSAIAIATDYEALIAVGDGEMTAADFAASHVTIRRGSRTAVRRLLGLMGRAFGG